jgi:hypothetical protein
MNIVNLDKKNVFVFSLTFYSKHVALKKHLASSARDGRRNAYR